MKVDKLLMQTKSYPKEIRSECFMPFSAGWSCPKPDEIRFLVQDIGLSGAQIAKLTGIKDGRQVRRWVGGDAKISFSVWAILVESAGYGIIWR